MRITNNIIANTTKANINNNKVNLSNLNNQMSTQKKIAKPSEDPVVAIRALRLRSSLSQINQYYEKNIPDAESWLEVTETALTNMKKVVTDIHTQCVNGATDTLTAEDRNTILEQLDKLSEQVYAEGNADYAGRTVFTGYKTNTTLTFMQNEQDTTYGIKQYIPASEIEEYTYEYNEVTVPTAGELSDAVTTGTTPADPDTTTVQRMRLAYGQTGDMNSLSYASTVQGLDGSSITTTVDLMSGMTTTTTTSTDGRITTDTAANGVSYAEMTTEQLEATGYVVGDDQVVYNKETGELLFGKNVAKEINTAGATVTVDYNKTGFSKGDLRPENYYDCVNQTDEANPITYTNYDENQKFIEQDINYTVAVNQSLNVNTIANNVFDSSMGRDVEEMMSAVKAAIAAHDTVDQIKTMMTQSQYADAASQAKLNEWLDAANKQADYADHIMKNSFSNGITKFSSYLSDVNLAITDVGSKGDRLDVIKTRMSSQQETVERLKSTNEDKELSDIVIDYTSSYTAYQASLQAAGKLEQQTLLDYL